jgi:AraC-like DNA-binding protein
MPKGMPPKPVNQQFFDEESRKMYYVLGAFYSSCIMPKRQTIIVFRNSNKDLVEIIRDEIESEHTIVSDPRENKSSHWFEMGSASHLHSRLKELGLNKPKRKRRFPRDIDEYYISHFVRGFLDAQGSVKIAKTSFGKRSELYIHFNHRFLKGLHRTIKKYAMAEHSRLYDDNLKYVNEDCSRIHDFIYRDFGFINRYGLYLPLKKKLLLGKNQGRWVNPRSVEASRKVDKAKRLLLQGKLAYKVAEQVGYTNPSALTKIFRETTGQTPTEFLEEFSNYQRAESFKRIQKAKKLLLRGKEVCEVAEELGYSCGTTLSRAFRKITGQTPTEFLQDNR